MCVYIYVCIYTRVCVHIESRILQRSHLKRLCFVWACRAQTIMKARLKGAQTGRNLLKKKSDALSMRFRQILRKIIEVSRLLGFLL